MIPLFMCYDWNETDHAESDRIKYAVTDRQQLNWNIKQNCDSRYLKLSKTSYNKSNNNIYICTDKERVLTYYTYTKLKVCTWTDGKSLHI